MKIKKMLTLALSASLLMSISACGKDAEKETPAPSSIPTATPTENIADPLGSSGAGNYSVKSLKLPGKPADVIVEKHGEYIYLFCVSRDTDYAVDGHWLLQYDSDSEEMTELWRDDGADSSVGDITVDDDGNVWLAKVYGKVTVDTMSFSPSLTMIGADGNTCTWEIEGVETNSVSNLLYQDGRLYINCRGFENDTILGFSVLDGSPDIDNPLFCVTTESAGTSLLLSGDGSLCLLGNDGNTNYLNYLEDDTGKAYMETFFETSVDAAYCGDENYSLYLSDRNNLYGYNTKTDTRDKLLNWVACAMPDTAYVIPLKAGALFCVRIDRDTLRAACEILTPTDDNQEIVTLTMGTAGYNYTLRDQVIALNKVSRYVKIDLLDYSVYNTNLYPEAGYAMLTSELDAGQFPDILDLYGLPIMQYAAKGYLYDFYTHMDKDKDFPREMFHENILRAFECEGRLYELPISFSIRTVAGKTDAVGAVPGWTLERYSEISAQTEASSPFGESYTRYEFLEAMLSYLGGTLVDWDAGTCNFDSEIFIKLLEVCETMPKSHGGWNNYEAVRGGNQYLLLCDISNLYSIRYNRGLFGDNGYTFIGFPGAPDSGSAVSSVYSFGISSGSQHKEDSWAVLKHFLSDDSLFFTEGLPITKSGFDAALTRSVKEENKFILANPESTIWMGESVSVPYRPEQDAEAIRALVAAQTLAARQDEYIADIVFENAANFLSGDKTAQDTAREIQKAAQVYIDALFQS